MRRWPAASLRGANVAPIRRCRAEGAIALLLCIADLANRLGGGILVQPLGQDRVVALTRFGGDCYAYGLLAMGFIDVIIEASLKPWDIQALIPIIENAGGVVSDWTGKSAVEGGRVVACGDARLHAAVLEVLTGR